jgi:hypothetical protein
MAPSGHCQAFLLICDLHRKTKTGTCATGLSATKRLKSSSYLIYVPFLSILNFLISGCEKVVPVPDIESRPVYFVKKILIIKKWNKLGYVRTSTTCKIFSEFIIICSIQLKIFFFHFF